MRALHRFLENLGCYSDESVETDPSPVPWVSDLVWAIRNQGWRSRPSETYRERVADREADGVPLYGYSDVVPRPADAEEMARALRIPPDPSLPVPPADDLASHRAALEHDTPPVGHWWNPGDWPVCCDRLAVMVLANPIEKELAPWEAAGRLDGIVRMEGVPEAERGALIAVQWGAELAAIRAGRRAEQGVHVFHCRSCGRLYGEYSLS